MAYVHLPLPKKVDTKCSLLLRQPVGRMCGGPRPFACAVGGCAGAVRWERLTLVLEAVKPVGCRQTSIFCLDGCSPTGSAGSTGVCWM